MQANNRLFLLILLHPAISDSLVSSTRARVYGIRAGGPLASSSFFYKDARNNNNNNNNNNNKTQLKTRMTNEDDINEVAGSLQKINLDTSASSADGVNDVVKRNCRHRRNGGKKSIKPAPPAKNTTALNGVAAKFSGDKLLPVYLVKDQPKDIKLADINDDPRGNDPSARITGKASTRGNGRNTESFDPASTLVRPAMRVLVGSSSLKTYNRVLKHDDVVMVPELFGPEDDWSLYYKLVDEMRDLQQKGERRSEWVAWHEGAHLITQNPKGSETFNMIIDRLCEYFNIKRQSIGTRFNWYRDSSDWKPFHHDSA